MAQVQATPCASCDELKELAPDFVQNGVTDEVCASLANDKGLNSANKNHNDCDDLKTANDCLIGGLYDDIERYDVCDWKCWARKMVANTFVMLGAVICAICGLWVNIHELWAEIDKIWKAINDILDRIKALENKVKNLCASGKKLVDALNNSVTAQSFVRYCRYTGVDVESLFHNMYDGLSETIDVYMDNNGASYGSQNADRDYLVLVSCCTNMRRIFQVQCEETWFSSADTRPIATIRDAQGQHPTIYNHEQTMSFAWTISASVIVRKGSHLRCNFYVDAMTGGNNPDYRIHQIQTTWIPISPVGGINTDGLFDC